MADPKISNGANDRPVDETLAETGPGLPSDAIGPGQMSVDEQIDLSQGPEAEAMARKLQAEADRFAPGR